MEKEKYKKIELKNLMCFEKVMLILIAIEVLKVIVVIVVFICCTSLIYNNYYNFNSSINNLSLHFGFSFFWFSFFRSFIYPYLFISLSLYYSIWMHLHCRWWDEANRTLTVVCLPLAHPPFRRSRSQHTSKEKLSIDSIVS